MQKHDRPLKDLGTATRHAVLLRAPMFRQSRIVDEVAKEMPRVLAVPENNALHVTSFGTWVRILAEQYARAPTSIHVGEVERCLENGRAIAPEDKTVPFVHLGAVDIGKRVVVVAVSHFLYGVEVAMHGRAHVQDNVHATVVGFVETRHKGAHFSVADGDLVRVECYLDARGACRC